MDHLISINSTDPGKEQYNAGNYSFSLFDGFYVIYERQKTLN